MIKDFEKISAIIEKLHMQGFPIAIDDFGTGYSSLNYLTRFPIGLLKIDMSFIQRISKSKNDDNIVIAVIAMAHSIGISVIAEGVETEQQLEFLRKHGCDQIQGYYFSKPLSVDQVKEYFEAQRHVEQTV